MLKIEAQRKIVKKSLLDMPKPSIENYEFELPTMEDEEDQQEIKRIDAADEEVVMQENKRK